MVKVRLFCLLPLLGVFTVACGLYQHPYSEEAATVPVAWVTAEEQEDEGKMWTLLAKKSRVLDPKDGADRHWTLDDYRLIAWKASDVRYFYRITYSNPRGVPVTEEMAVIQTNQGWKRTTYADLTNFSFHIRHLAPVVIRP
ncbi:hypothetical protein [Thalassobacillus pellis]|uniref:hypothetical protein n=1 Tax=Thalassobacillus pellis TaxID=748008 RepID=UPI001961FD8F|nr:hypothetical protein [Thalassobacillus pellis]MBM7554552.1 hypothetical protein [Thalassobacillus pellis]